MLAAVIAQQIAQSYQPPHTGVPSRIREADTVSELLQAIEDGNYIETAAELAGLTKQSVYEWLKRGETGEQPFKLFADALKRAQARAEAAEVAKVRKAGEDPRFWAASMTYLERRHPDRWARRSEDGSSPKVVVQIGVRDSDVQVQVNAIDTYQTQKISECVTTQLLAASPLDGFARESGERNPDDRAKGQTADDAL